VSRDTIPDFGPELYGRWRASELGAETESLERTLILELGGDVTGCTTLDIGCGDGDFALALRKRGAIVTATDASPAMIHAAEERAEKLGADVAFKVATAQNLPFAAGQFDLVTAIAVLCFIEDAAAVFREVARVLRPGGRFILGELGKWSSWAAQRRIRAWLGSRLWRGARFRTARGLGNLAAESGLVVQQVRGAIYYPRWALAARLLSPWDVA
jgi:ubiquinone/menaquinone biosynthesis C-methylase UbiE